MNKVSAVSACVVTSAFALGLAGCSGSSQGPAPSAAQVAAAKAYAPSNGTFAVVPAAQLQSVRDTTSDCNLDGVDDKPAGSEPLPHTGSALLSGWAADSAAAAVPPGVQLVLTGAQDYAVNVATGALREDVAKATKQPAFATAGYAVQANLSAVTPGEYGVTLLYSAGGRAVKCVTAVKLTVQ